MINGMAPYLWIVGFAALMLLPGMALLFGSGGRNHHGRRVFRIRPIRRLIGVLFVCLALVSAALSVSLLQFFRLTDDTPVASVSMTQNGPQAFTMTLVLPDGTRSDYALHGDEWQLDARVVRWRLPALLAGVPPLYRLERVAGRFRDLSQETSLPKTAYDLANPSQLDIGAMRRRFPSWLPFVDVQFGSAAYMPMLDAAQFRVFIDPRGALFIRPADDVTTQALHAAGW